MFYIMAASLVSLNKAPVLILSTVGSQYFNLILIQSFLTPPVGLFSNYMGNLLMSPTLQMCPIVPLESKASLSHSCVMLTIQGSLTSVYLPGSMSCSSLRLIYVCLTLSSLQIYSCDMLKDSSVPSSSQTVSYQHQLMMNTQIFGIVLKDLFSILVVSFALVIDTTLFTGIPMVSSMLNFNYCIHMVRIPTSLYGFG